MRSGYTLIEILIVVTLIGLLTGASIAGFNALNSRQTVISAGKEIVSMMRTAQQRASAGIKPENCDQLEGYSVSALALAQDYALSGVCTNRTVVIKTAKLPVNVFFQSGFSVLFGTQAGGASGNIGDLTIQSPTHTFVINISGAGDIWEKGVQ